MNEQIHFDDLVRIVKNKRNQIIFTVIICTTTFLLASFILPKKYKSFGVLNVYTKYFKNPLVGEVITELQNTDEIKNNLESLIYEAIDDDFINKMAERYNLYQSNNQIKINAERELLRQKFQITALGHQSFQLGFLHSDPVVAKEVAQAILHEVIGSLVKHRKKQISDIKESIRKRIEVMNFGQGKFTNPLASEKPEILARDLIRIRSEIKALRHQFSDTHPQIQELMAKEKIVSKWLANSPLKPGDAEVDPTINERDQMPIISGDSKGAMNEISKDLLIKYNYLNIISELENTDLPDYIGIIQYPQIPPSPIFPNKSLFLIFGLLIGIVLSAIIILFEDYVLGGNIPIQIRISQKLKIAYLGKLPVLNPDDIKINQSEIVDKSGPKKREWN